MPAKKTTQQPAKKSAGKLTPAFKPTKKQAEAARKRAEADMKKHGFKSVDELTDYYDRQRGY